MAKPARTSGAPHLSSVFGSTRRFTSTDDEYREAVLQGMHDSLLKDLDALQQAAIDLQSAAPTPVGRGWDVTLDAAAITTMKATWVRARAAYEHEEGAIAPLFPDID